MRSAPSPRAGPPWWNKTAQLRLGGVLGLVIWILISPVTAFTIPSEVGKMYEGDGLQPPITGWTGLWLFPFGIFIIPAIVWFVKVQGALNRYWESAGTRSV